MRPKLVYFKTVIMTLFRFYPVFPDLRLLDIDDAYLQHGADVPYAGSPDKHDFDHLNDPERHPRCVISWPPMN
jgi:hypothetical protein